MQIPKATIADGGIDTKATKTNKSHNHQFQ
jgi:hypothetical protein